MNLARTTGQVTDLGMTLSVPPGLEIPCQPLCLHEGLKSGMQMRSILDLGRDLKVSVCPHQVWK